MLTRIVTSALFAGFAAGLIAAALQLVFVQPLLLHAEHYESGRLVHFGAQKASDAHVDTGGIDWHRDGLSFLFTTLIYTGYAFLLVSAMAAASMRGISVRAKTGLVWGLAGFLAVHFAPAVGLPPELPGAAAADVGVRQIWWFATAAATAVGLGLLAFGHGWMPWMAGAILIAAPHVIGAPHPLNLTGPAPPELAAGFATRALGVGLVAWALLGLFSAWFWEREARHAENLPQTA
ncbi:MAG: CbtA family protein [Rhodospirillaceae bacterium]|nr:CbtA family protein [Rhodospirillaceae bacterium]